jgi:hypothetical protein
VSRRWSSRAPKGSANTHRGGEQRLHHHDPPEDERDRLQDEAEGVRDDPGQTGCFASRTSRPAFIASSSGTSIAAVVQHGADSEQERGTEREDDVH